MSGKGHFEPSMSILLSLLLVCSLILVFITACAADTQAESRRQLPDCEQFGANCSTCTAKGGCGWCMRPTSGGLLNGSCVAGDNSGATGPATCSLWFYQNCHNVGACEASTCGACTVLTPAGTGCGWCAATNVCLPGNSSGPSEAEHATCPKPFWVWGRANCALEPSISASASPTSSPSPSPSSSPLPSSSSSPSPSTSPSLSPSTSPSPSVSASASPSPGHDDRCPMLASNCTTCVAGAQCLWCPATATCFNVTRVPPSQCPNGATNECNDEFCGNITSCADCTKQAVCGWCNYTRCVAGRTSGPAHGSCSAYQYNSCAPLSCSSFGECATCTQPGNTHCAWCDPTSRCMPILNPPPRPGDAECPHNWFYLECPAPVECSRYRNCVECMDFAPHCWWCTNDPFQLCASSPQSGYSCMQQPDQCAAPPRPSGGGGGLDGGAIAGIVVGSVCATGIVPAAVFLWYKYYYSPRHHYATLA